MQGRALIVSAIDQKVQKKKKEVMLTILSLQ